MSIIKVSQIEKEIILIKLFFLTLFIIMKNWKQSQYVNEKLLNYGIITQ